MKEHKGDIIFYSIAIPVILLIFWFTFREDISHIIDNASILWLHIRTRETEGGNDAEPESNS